MDSADIDRQWWKEAVVYQIYPRSFNDTDGDGVGDIPGIIEKLDYLDELGVDVVWLNPVYESPNADNGYDIADYQSIMDEFGTMSDWEDLLDGLHDRDIKLIMDLVVNHTSDEHEWFVKSREGDEEFRDYYIWRNGRTDVDGWTGHLGPDDEAPPNDWGSFFGGPAWEYDEDVGEWYLHLFDVKQPDLNWENEDVREEVFSMMEWWLEKGIDGFRMDVINLISKPPSVTEHNPPEPDGFDATFDGPKIHEYVGEMGERVLSDDLLTVGEVVGDVSMDDARQYVGRDGDGLGMLFHFDHMLLDRGGDVWEYYGYDLTDLKDVFRHWQKSLEGEGWNSNYLNNHDQPRMVSRFGDDVEYRVESAKLLGTLLHTLHGTPYIYQGEELGMTNYPFERLDDYQDVDTLNPVQNALDEGVIENFDDVKDSVAALSRDNARTPMQWTDEEHAGFTDGEPWLAVNPNHEEINADTAREDDDSVFHYYRNLIALRDDDDVSDVLVYGSYDDLWPSHTDLWAYTRTLDDERLLVVLNFTSEDQQFRLPREDEDHATYADELPLHAGEVADLDTELLVSNYDEDVESDPTEFALRPWEARVYHLS
ncbi:oligo-1,6-glucosidase [Halogranum rubrum]|uniref:Oligo-1,6-glucosidase n=1 Tax=Halogranum rubrum TaxID=553466 RepID=A0A1I4ENP6_9EURY|nr:alpha-glucosidase [Halogranum rubrum]SFL06929.1 oligo-1,6-glucosidase [Halogranum rubrum]